jgi:tRNA nucleotidyltransferase/poly(A) polymerase
MKKSAETPVRELATDIVRRLQSAGHSAFWVGGCVRDFLLGREPGDYDIATSALPEQVESLFKRTVAVGRKFGVIVVIENKLQFQVATFRAEADYRDGRRPEKIVFSDAKADAARRDFTINGLFYDPIAKQLHDWVGGETDLRKRVIQTIGCPAERFAEDHLRLLRAVRFAAQLDFLIEPATFAAVKAAASKIKAISAERVRDELIKMFAPQRFGVPPSGGGARLSSAAASPNTGSAAGEDPHAPVEPPEGGTPNSLSCGLELLRQSGLLEHILPELAATITCEQSPDFHPEGTVFEHLKLMLSHLPSDAHPLLPWAVLLHDIAKPLTASRDLVTGGIHFYEHEKIGAEMAVTILERLRFPRKQIEEIADAVRYHMQFKDAPQMRKSTLRRMLMRDTFPLELQLHRLDCLGSHGRLDVYDFLVQQAEDLKKKPTIRPPLLTGKDLIKLGMKPGPAMGKLLAEIREMQLQDELKTCLEARKWAKRRIEDCK